MAQKMVVPITFRIAQGALVRTETIAQDVIKVGRDQKSHLRIDDEGVARMHAVIEVKPDDVQIIDLGSGTQVNGQAINKASLRTGDVITLGGAQITVEVGEAREVGSFVSPALAAPLGAAASALVVAEGGSSPITSTSLVGEGEEIYQLIKRGEINPHEVEEVGSHAVEISVMWKSSILHVAHLRDSQSFVLTGKDPTLTPASKITGALWGVGGVLMAVGAAKADPQHLNDNSGLVVGGVGALTALVGSGIGINLSHKNEDRLSDVSQFTVGPEILGGASELPVVVNNAGTRFVFLPGATGEVELQGVKRSLDDGAGCL
jgi:pSer/pThr/pTyr-binding forkhead associated (FHA) protein